LNFISLCSRDLPINILPINSVFSKSHLTPKMIIFQSGHFNHIRVERFLIPSCVFHSRKFANFEIFHDFHVQDNIFWKTFLKRSFLFFRAATLWIHNGVMNFHNGVTKFHNGVMNFITAVWIHNVAARNPSYPGAILWPKKALKSSKVSAHWNEQYAFQCWKNFVRTGVKNNQFLLILSIFIKNYRPKLFFFIHFISKNRK
jgi:hypothetical protein